MTAPDTDSIVDAFYDSLDTIYDRTHELTAELRNRHVPASMRLARVEDAALQLVEEIREARLLHGAALDAGVEGCRLGNYAP